MITFLTNLWQAFNGYKTSIGAFLLGLSAIITHLVIGQIHYDAHWLDVLVIILNYFGIAFAGTGLIHQQIKQNQSAKLLAQPKVTDVGTAAKDPSQV